MPLRGLADPRTSPSLNGKVRSWSNFAGLLSQRRFAVVWSILMTNSEIALVRLPGDTTKLAKLRQEGQPRLIFVEGDCEPPITLDVCEDWIRVPADERDVIARQEGLRRRLQAPKDDEPTLDEAGLLRFRGSWVSIPPMEVRLLAQLLDHLGSVVPRGDLAEATWPEGAKGRNALDVHMLRLRRRVNQVGLAIRTVRARGYLLEVPGDIQVVQTAS